jgi:Ca2+-binding EF-hand superfamily protein
MFEHLDANNDGKLTADEAPAKIKERFSSLDTNSDGSLDEPELRKIGMGRRPDRDGGRPNKGPEGKAPEKPADAPPAK